MLSTCDRKHHNLTFIQLDKKVRFPTVTEAIVDSAISFGKQCFKL